MKVSGKQVAATIAALVTGGIGVGVAVWGSGEGATARDGAPAQHEARPDAGAAALGWAELPARQEITVSMAPQGPAFARGAQRLSATLWPEGVTQERWAQAPGEQGVMGLEGAARWQGAPVDVRWALMPGDPQARVTMKLAKAPRALLGAPIEATLRLPPGEVSYLSDGLWREALGDEEVTLNSWTPGWLRWGEGEGAITLSEWSFDQVRVKRDAEGVTLRLVWWHPSHHPAIASCPEVPGRDTLTLAHAMTWTFGARLDVVAGRLGQGYEAAVAPLLVDPSAYGAPALLDGAAIDAADWATRARAILFGHSSAEDPRYGNGGLLGIDQGAALAAPEGMWDAPEVRALADELADRGRVTLGALGPRPPAGGVGVWRELDCQAYLGRRDDAAREAMVVMGREGAATNMIASRVTLELGQQRAMSAPPATLAGLPLWLELERLPIERAAWLEGALGREALRELVAARGVTWFAAPLVATRNPLVRAAQVQLLAPERQGRWTLDPALTSALTRVELAQESREVMLASPVALAQHWARARQVRLYERPDGNIALYNPHDEALPHLTLIWSGPGGSPTLDEVTPDGLKSITTPRGEAQSWAWWTLPAGASTLRFQDAEEGLAATRWRLP